MHLLPGILSGPSATLLPINAGAFAVDRSSHDRPIKVTFAMTNSISPANLERRVRVMLERSSLSRFASLCELMLTNLGNLPYKFAYGNLKLKALWGPAVFTGFQGEQTVGVATMNGSLCLLHSSFTPLASLLQHTERILHSACKK